MSPTRLHCCAIIPYHSAITRQLRASVKMAGNHEINLAGILWLVFLILKFNNGHVGKYNDQHLSAHLWHFFEHIKNMFTYPCIAFKFSSQVEISLWAYNVVSYYLCHWPRSILYSFTFYKNLHLCIHSAKTYIYRWVSQQIMSVCW